MDLNEIELVTKYTAERTEMQLTCDELKQAQQTVAFFERRVAFNRKGLFAAQEHLRSAQRKMNSLVEQIQRDSVA